mgnify:CR=1 FL=1
MELGTGNMDLDSLMTQALAVNVDAIILESHRNWVDNSPVKSFQLSAKYLAQKFLICHSSSFSSSLSP